MLRAEEVIGDYSEHGEDAYNIGTGQQQGTPTRSTNSYRTSDDDNEASKHGGSAWPSGNSGI